MDLSVFEELIGYEFKDKERGYVEIIRAYVIELIIKLFRQLEKHQA